MYSVLAAFPPVQLVASSSSRFDNEITRQAFLVRSCSVVPSCSSFSCTCSLSLFLHRSPYVVYAIYALAVRTRSWSSSRSAVRLGAGGRDPKHATRGSYSEHAGAFSLSSPTTMSAGPSPTKLSSLPTYQSTTPSRLRALYSDFSPHKHSNPSSFSSNVEWWRRTLEAAVLKGWQSPSAVEAATPDRLILHANGPALAEVFRCEAAGKPLSLAAVIVSPPPPFAVPQCEAH